jgi:hypothetical protein
MRTIINRPALIPYNAHRVIDGVIQPNSVYAEAYRDSYHWLHVCSFDGCRYLYYPERVDIDAVITGLLLCKYSIIEQGILEPLF